MLFVYIVSLLAWCGVFALKRFRHTTIADITFLLSGGRAGGGAGGGGVAQIILTGGSSIMESISKYLFTATAMC